MSIIHSKWSSIIYFIVLISIDTDVLFTCCNDYGSPLLMGLLRPDGLNFFDFKAVNSAFACLSSFCFFSSSAFYHLIKIVISWFFCFIICSDFFFSRFKSWIIQAYAKFDFLSLRSSFALSTFHFSYFSVDSLIFFERFVFYVLIFWMSVSKVLILFIDFSISFFNVFCSFSFNRYSFSLDVISEILSSYFSSSYETLLAGAIFQFWVWLFFKTSISSSISWILM